MDRQQPPSTLLESRPDAFVVTAPEVEGDFAAEAAESQRRLTAHDCEVTTGAGVGAGAALPPPASADEAGTCSIAPVAGS